MHLSLLWFNHKNSKIKHVFLVANLYWVAFWKFFLGCIFVKQSMLEGPVLVYMSNHHTNMQGVSNRSCQVKISSLANRVELNNCMSTLYIYLVK